MLNDLARSLQTNFLNFQVRLYQIYFLNSFNQETQLRQAIEEIIETDLLLTYSREKKNIKSKIKIMLNAEDDSVTQVNEHYTFLISKDSIDGLTNVIAENSFSINQLESIIKNFTKEFTPPVL